MALHTGLRKTELATLTWRDVDWGRGVVRVRPEHAKSGEMREVPMDRTVQALLRGLQPEGVKPREAVFRSRLGRSFKDLTKLFIQTRKRAELEDVHFHDLRHTFASRLVMGGVDLRTVQELLGHADIKMTQRYAHLSAAHKQQAVFILDNVSQQNSQRMLVGEIAS